MSKIKPEKNKRGASAAQKGVSEIFPSKQGIPVDFTVTADMLEKHRKAVISAGARKVKKGKPEGGGEDNKSIEIDEFDAIVDGTAVSTEGGGDAAKPKKAGAK